MLSLEALAVNSILWKVDLYQVQRRSFDVYLFLGGEGVDLTVTLGCALFPRTPRIQENYPPHFHARRRPWQKAKNLLNR